MPMQGTQLPSVAMPPRVPLVTNVENRDDSSAKDAKLVNCYAEYNPTTEDWSIEKRPGYTTNAGFSQATAGAGLGIYNWKGELYSILDDTLYRDGVSLGTVDNTAHYEWEELLGEEWLVLNNGVAAYYTDGVTLTEMAMFMPVLAGAFTPPSAYTIVSPGNTDFTTVGASDSNIGTSFTANDLGDPATTGTAALNAGSLIIGVRYEINTVGSTDFTLIGAASNTVGVRFEATGVGTGTGTVLIPNFPENHVKGWAYLDGTLYVMDRRSRIYGTSTLPFGGIGGLDDPRVWDPLNVIVARTSTGRGVSLRSHLSYVAAFKYTSTEFFYDAGNPTGSPLATVQGAHSTHGCIHADTIQNFKGTMIWMTSGVPAARQIVLAEEVKVRVISTPSIERLIETVAPTDILSWSFQHAGHRFYGLTLEGINTTLVFDLDQNLWYHWTDTDGNYWPISGHSSQALNYGSFIQHESNGKIYDLAADYVYPNDDGEVVGVDVITRNFDGDTRRHKHLGAMFFNGDKVLGSELEVRVSDDDYQHWSNPRLVDLGQKRPALTDCGTFNRRAWWLRHRKNTPLRIESIDLQIDMGTL